jgi:hypothetical protein
MRKTFICWSLSGLALFAGFDLCAKVSVNYSADQSASCPPLTTAAGVDDNASTTPPDAAPAAPTQPATAPIKSGKSTRPRWKALLPGTIK